MKFKSKLMALVATVGLSTGLAVFAPMAHAASIPVGVVEDTGGGGPIYMNRAGGGAVKGTKVVGYGTFDNNDDFTFADELSSWCGGTGKVRNGEGGITCPFTVGSGLNSRYDGAELWTLHSYNTGFYAAIPNFSNHLVALGNLGDQGDAWIQNDAGYVVSVGESNWAYANGGGANKPQWLDTNGNVGAQLLAGGPANTGTWSCYLNNGHEEGC